MKQFKNEHTKIIILFLLFLVMFPLFLFPIYSNYYHQVFGSPQIQKGVLDLQGYDLEQNCPIPLDGEWEFFNGRWIVSDGSDRIIPDQFIAAPMIPSQYPDLHSSKQRMASYRILLKNCPTNIPIFCYIPNIGSHYRVFLNNALVASCSTMLELTADKDQLLCSHTGNTLIQQTVFAPPNGEAELVIEVFDLQVGGLYMTPMLTELNTYLADNEIKNLLAAALVGISTVTLGCITALLLLHEKRFSSASLLLMNLLVFIRILFQNDYLSFLKDVLPVSNYWINMFLQFATLFLPVAFIFSARKIVLHPIQIQRVQFITFYELLLTPFLLWSSWQGYLRITLLIYVLSCLPFLFILKMLYDKINKQTPYAFLTSAVLMLLLASTIGTSMSNSGWLLMDISLFSPVCFTLAMLLQLWLFLQHSMNLQQEAIETENLQLRLQQSEVNLRLSQIKPHFLYNTLIAIHVLCTDNPQTAAETTLKFANFLRTNMNFINSQELIPFAQELAHIQNYPDIELLRYQKRLTVHYDIQATQFCVPPLSIQPLVENAIRHGACKKIKGGTVSLQTSETSTHIVLQIIDDGPGFDPQKLDLQSEKHQGLQNIMFRLEQQCDAQIKIHSVPDEGTTVQILLPKETCHECNYIG